MKKEKKKKCQNEKLPKLEGIRKEKKERRTGKGKKEREEGVRGGGKLPEEEFLLMLIMGMGFLNFSCVIQLLNVK